MFFKSIRRQRATRRTAGILLILISPALTPGVQHSDDWVKYDSKEGRYSVMLPGQPTIGSQEAASADGIKFIQYKASVFSANIGYLIGYFDYHAAMTFTFDTGRDGVVSAVKGTLISEKTITFESFPGREMRISAKDKNGIEYDMRVRFYDIDRRIYVLQFIAPKSIDVGMADVKAAKYFDSFQVVRAQN